MTKDEAHSLLNAVRAGHQATTREIMLALLATGDLGPVVSRSAPLVQRAPELTEAV